MGTATVSLVKSKKIRDANGKEKIELIVDITLSNSYATGGDDIDFSAYVTSVDTIVLENSVVGSYLLEVDRSNSKIKAYSAIGTEVTAGTDLSSVSVRAVVYGSG